MSDTREPGSAPTVEPPPFGTAEILAAVVGARRVLDAGCGSGRLTVALAQAGADVTGIDTNAGRLAAARRRAERAGVDLTLVEADLFDPVAASGVAQSAGEGLAAVVNLVGGFAAGGRVHETPADVLDDQLRLNLRPAWLVTSAALPALLRADIQAHIRELTERMRRLEQQARQLVDATPALRRSYQHLRTLKGIGQRSALLILSELAVLPAHLRVRQWVAHSGLDPRPIRSGSSVTWM